MHSELCPLNLYRIKTIEDEREDVIRNQTYFTNTGTGKKSIGDRAYKLMVSVMKDHNKPDMKYTPAKLWNEFYHICHSGDSNFTQAVAMFAKKYNTKKKPRSFKDVIEADSVLANRFRLLYDSEVRGEAAQFYKNICRYLTYTQRELYDSMLKLPSSVNLVVINGYRRFGKDTMLLSLVYQDALRTGAKYSYICANATTAEAMMGMTLKDCNIKLVDLIPKEAHPLGKSSLVNVNKRTIIFRNGATIHFLIGGSRSRSEQALRGRDSKIVVLTEVAYWRHLKALRAVVTPMINSYEDGRILVAMTPSDDTSMTHDREFLEDAENAENAKVYTVPISKSYKTKGVLLFPIEEQERIKRENPDSYGAEYELRLDSKIMRDNTEANFLLNVRSLYASGRYYRIKYDPQRMIISAFDLGMAGYSARVTVQVYLIGGVVNYKLISSEITRGVSMLQQLQRANKPTWLPYNHAIILPFDSVRRDYLSTETIPERRGKIAKAIANLGFHSHSILSTSSKRNILNITNNFLTRLHVSDTMEGDRVLEALESYTAKKANGPVASSTGRGGVDVVDAIMNLAKGADESNDFKYLKGRGIAGGILTRIKNKDTASKYPYEMVYNERTGLREYKWVRILSRIADLY